MASTTGREQAVASVNDPNMGLRLRLSGHALPDPSGVEAELRQLVLDRLDRPSKKA